MHKSNWWLSRWRPHLLVLLNNGRWKLTNVSSCNNLSSEYIFILFFVFTLDEMTSRPSSNGRGRTSPGLQISLRRACFAHSASLWHPSCILYCRSPLFIPGTGCLFNAGFHHLKFFIFSLASSVLPLYSALSHYPKGWKLWELKKREKKKLVWF